MDAGTAGIHDLQAVRAQGVGFGRVDGQDEGPTGGCGGAGGAAGGLERYSKRGNARRVENRQGRAVNSSNTMAAARPRAHMEIAERRLEAGSGWGSFSNFRAAARVAAMNASVWSRRSWHCSQTNEVFL